MLVRADFDVPLRPGFGGGPGTVADDMRIRAALPTLEELRRRAARIVLVAHLGQPKGPDPAFSMRPVADRLEGLTGAPIRRAPTVVGPYVRGLTEELLPGEMLMLENVRFEAGEMRNDPALGSALAELADVYVDDAFAAAHRAHASTCAVAHHLPSAAGRLMEREMGALSTVVDRPARPLVAVVGGALLRERIGVVRRFLELADVLCVGGALCFPFLAALDRSIGYSLCPRDDVDLARTALSVAAGSSHRLALPKDFRLARWGVGERATRLHGPDIPDGWIGLDIGAKTAASYADRIAGAATVLWNGPMGRFELPQFAAGTREVAGAVAAAPATTVVGGGETVQALRGFGLQDQVNHVSSGGAAMLEFLEGRELPGVEVLLHGEPPSHPVSALRPVSGAVNGHGPRD